MITLLNPTPEESSLVHELATNSLLSSVGIFRDTIEVESKGEYAQFEFTGKGEITLEFEED